MLVDASVSRVLGLGLEVVVPVHGAAVGVVSTVSVVVGQPLPLDGSGRLGSQGGRGHDRGGRAEGVGAEAASNGRGGGSLSGRRRGGARGLRGVGGRGRGGDRGGLGRGSNVDAGGNALDGRADALDDGSEASNDGADGGRDDDGRGLGDTGVRSDFNHGARDSFLGNGNGVGHAGGGAGTSSRNILGDGHDVEISDNDAAFVKHGNGQSVGGQRGRDKSRGTHGFEW